MLDFISFLGVVQKCGTVKNLVHKCGPIKRSVVPSQNDAYTSVEYFKQFYGCAPFEYTITTAQRLVSMSRDNRARVPPA